MSNHLSMRSGNPALQASTFKKHLTSSTESKMTLSGTVNKTGISLLLLIISAGYTWGNPAMHVMMLPAGIIGFFLALQQKLTNAFVVNFRDTICRLL